MKKYIRFFLGLVALASWIYLLTSQPSRRQLRNWMRTNHRELKYKLDNADCAILQQELNLVKSNSANQQSKSGQDNDKVLRYIERKMKTKKCD
jgi:hypothetical protein